MPQMRAAVFDEPGRIVLSPSLCPMSARSTRFCW